MDIFELKESHVQSYSTHFPVLFNRAQGSCLYSAEGQRYLDFLSGAGALNYGHNNAILKDALIEYIRHDGVTHGLDMHTSAKAHFLDTLNRFILIPRKLDYKVQFTGPTGTNAVEAALKLARKVKQRSQIVAFTNGFHGCTYGALAATGNQHHRGGAGQTLNNVTRIPYENYAGVEGLTLLQTLLDDKSSGMDKPAAVLVETVQGEGGLNAASGDWLRALERLCRQNDILLIVDDIQAGCGRTGTFFSFEPSGIVPDMVTLSKSISGYGLPMALVLLKPELDIWLPGEHNGTFRGNNHAFITAARAIETYWADDEFEKHIQTCSAALSVKINEWIRRYPALFVRQKGRGMMQGIECIDGDVAEQISAECFERKMIIETAGSDGEVLKFFCPLVTSIPVLQEGIAIFESAVKAYVSSCLKKVS